jgi:phage portal protein BeeE
MAVAPPGSDHPIAAIVSVDPNIDQTTQEFWGAHAAALVIFGNAYAEKRFPASARRAGAVCPTTPPASRQGKLAILDYRYVDRGKTETCRARRCFTRRDLAWWRRRHLAA